MTETTSATDTAAYTPPVRPSGVEPPDTPKMLSLPRAGHQVAVQWWVCGVITYIVLTGAFLGTLLTSGRATIASLFGLGDPPNIAIFLLVASGVTLSAFATWSAWLDIRKMRREEVDVDWVHKKGRRGLMLVFVDAAKREAMFGRHVDVPEHDITVETLMDDRVRRIHNAAIDPNAGAVVPVDLKGVAEVRTSELGSFARYASSLLLLLAVLGTFAGVKTALPGLIDSITASTSTAAAGDANAGLIRSLNAVAEAFGGNALALIGAISVGLIAQGVGFGRRNLLERLELVSAEFLYGQNVTADANPMQAAMVALRDTAREMQSASGAMIGIEDQLQQLGREFRSAFDALSNRLHEIAVDQEEALYAKTGDALLSLQQRVGDLTSAVEANARTYAGLAEAVKHRSQEATRAFDAMGESNKKLGQALESILQTGERSRESVEALGDAAKHLAASGDRAVLEIQRVAGAAETISPAINELEAILANADRRLTHSEKIAQDGWRSVADEIAKKLDGVPPPRDSRVATDVREFVARSSAASDDRAIRLLQSIASGIEQLRTPTQPSLVRIGTAAFAGVVVASAVVAAAMRWL